MKIKLNKQLRSLKAKIFRNDTEIIKRIKKALSEKAQGSAFSGSSYNAKGNADHGKLRSNKKRR